VRIWPSLRHRPGERAVPPELECLFATIVDLQTHEVIGSERLQAGVYRLVVKDARGSRDGRRARSLIVKRLGPERALRNRLVLERWLPAVGLEAVAPRLLGVAAEPDGRRVWHVYGDLGDDSLAAEDPDPARVASAVEAIARLHLRFAGHGLLGECRLWGGDLGIHFFASSVRDAIYALESLRHPGAGLEGEHRALRDQLLDRLHGLLAEEADRCREMREWGGPETLLHGDLWRDNVRVVPTPAGPEARLIDWDHAAVGPVAYDISTLLARFPLGERLWILERYQQCIAAAGWRLPPLEQLNSLFATAEQARIVNRLIWPAIAMRQADPEWGAEALTEVAGWLDGVQPVLPVPRRGSGPVRGGGGQ